MTNFNYPYQQMYAPQNAYNVPQNAYNVPQQSDERIWVANEQAADSYLVAPNSMVRLWDSNKNVFYEKKADATGRLYPMETYEYRKIEHSGNTKNSFDYRKELDSLKERITALEGVKKHEQSNGNNKRA